MPHADGKIAFQDAPCAPGQGGKIWETSGQPAATARPQIPAQPAQQHQPQPGHKPKPSALMPRPKCCAKKTACTHYRCAPSRRPRRRRRQKLRCDGELIELKTKATRQQQPGRRHLEQSISSEMAATATRCDTESRTLTKKELNTLLQEQEAIKKPSENKPSPHHAGFFAHRIKQCFTLEK